MTQFHTNLITTFRIASLHREYQISDQRKIKTFNYFLNAIFLGT